MEQSESPNRRDGAVLRASASQPVDLGFIPSVESYQKTLENAIHTFPAWRSAYKRDNVKNKQLACCVFGQGTNGTLPPLCGRQVVHPYFTGLQL